MARIRTIKPEFPQSDSIGKVSREARLLFIQLWTIADDVGRARASSRVLASILYPFDEDARGLIEVWLVELEREELIRRYEVDGTQYLDIPKWLKHQKIDRPSKSRLPAFVASPREGSRALDAGPRNKKESKKEKEPFFSILEKKAASAAKNAAKKNGAGTPAEQERELYERGKAVLGQNAGGLISRLLAAKHGDAMLALAAILAASSKQDPREYIGALLRPRTNGFFRAPDDNII